MSLDLLKASFSAMFNALSKFASQLPPFLEKVTGISSATLIKYFQYAVAALLILLSMLILQRVYRLLLPRRFAHRYHISRLPKQTIIKRRLPISRNTYELRFPSWQYANADGTRDQRRKGNHVNWQSSCLLIDSYKIFMKNPLQMMRLVRHLREEGFEIAPCSQELKKQESQFSALSSYRSGSSKELHRRFQSDPFEFEEYCAALFRAMGKRAQTMIQMARKELSNANAMRQTPRLDVRCCKNLWVLRLLTQSSLITSFLSRQATSRKKPKTLLKISRNGKAFPLD